MITSPASRLAEQLRARLADIMAKRASSIPAARITSKKPKASRRSINKTATSQEHKAQITSAANAYFPPSYGPCQAGIKIFAIGNIGTDTVIGGWFAFGEIEEITKIRCNGDDVPGTVTITEYTGTTAQTADPTLQSAISGYNDDLVLNIGGTDIGIAYIVARIPKGAVKGFPRFTVEWKGNKNIYDPRDSSTAYSDNPALCFRDWLKSSVYGPNFDVDDDTVKTAADACDETVGDTWTQNTAKSLGDFAVPTTGNTLNRSYECTTAGTTGGTEPATTNDGSVVWTCRDGRRRICGMLMDSRADVSSWIETWRTAAGCMVNWGENGIEMIPDRPRATDHTFKHADAEIRETPSLELFKEGLANRPNVIQVIYTNTSGNPWRDGTDARVAAAGVDAGTVQERLSIVRMPWIHRKAQAMREATERYNAAALTDLGFSLPVFDKGLKVKAGDVSEVTHPIGLTDKPVRAMGTTQDAPGKWTIDYWEYDPAVYSDHLETEPTYPDFELHTGIEVDFANQITGSEKPANNATKGATWGDDINGQPDDALLLNELNGVGGYEEVAFPNETGLLNRIDCYINNSSGTAYWFKVAEFELKNNYECGNWNGILSYGGSDGRYESQMRVKAGIRVTGSPTTVVTHYRYSGDDLTANLKVCYDQPEGTYTRVTFYAYVERYHCILFDGAWSCHCDGAGSSSWVHTLQNQSDNVGTTEPSGKTWLTATKNYDLGADITSEKTANNANNYTGNSIATSYTAAKCTDADADETATHTARNTTYIDGSVNRSGYGSCEFNNDLKAQGSSKYCCYYSSTYKGGLYANANGVTLYGVTTIGLSASGNIDLTGTSVRVNGIRPLSAGSDYCGFSSARWGNVYSLGLNISSGSSVVIGSSGSTFTLHLWDGAQWLYWPGYID